jgi:hypothetical protein
MRKRRILVIGNSHSQMLLQALREREAQLVSLAPIEYRIAWLQTEKYGDTSLEDAENEVSSLRKDDLLVMARLGAQHNKMSLFCHKAPYRLYDEQVDEVFGPEDAEIIPQSAIEDTLKGMVEKDKVVSKLKSKAICQTLHFPPPPPKEMGDKEGTMVKAAESESVFMRFEHPMKRLCIWRLEQSVTNRYLMKLGVRTCNVPDVAVDKKGFLLPEYSAPDLTHANSKYGHMLLRHFEDAIDNI